MRFSYKTSVTLMLMNECENSSPVQRHLDRPLVNLVSLLPVTPAA